MLFVLVVCKRGLAGTSENKFKLNKGGSKKGIALMLNFGLSLAVKLYLVGVLFGGWLDRRFGGGNGYITILMVFITIVYSIYMLYRDLVRLEKAETQNNLDGNGDKLE